MVWELSLNRYRKKVWKIWICRKHRKPTLPIQMFLKPGEPKLLPDCIVKNTSIPMRTVFQTIWITKDLKMNTKDFFSTAF
jgi:hypothetical protein